MSEHDPLCRNRWNTKTEIGSCQCALIAKARADEREKIAKVIEAVREERWAEAMDKDDDIVPPGHEEGMEFAFRIAAKIARWDNDVE